MKWFLVFITAAVVALLLFMAPATRGTVGNSALFGALFGVALSQALYSRPKSGGRRA